MAELVAKRYGTALFELAVETNKIDVVEDQLKSLKEILLTEKEFIRILNHPKVVVENKIAMVENIFDGKIIKDILGLLVIAIRKGRADDLLDIIQYCLDEIDKLNGNAKAYVTSASELTDEQLESIKSKLEETTKKKILLHSNVDESLIGGLVIRIGDRIIDNSIKGKIEAISKELYAIQLG
ncbi:ATP synthase subunit delta [Vallitalea longa]|uniref:ATP synthase subunit delta n=1 Tax=Vallitalea longa TaxID=2936439 RepID=A0A9W6DGM5_9FIRM|nr:ATP synthase F1 subunit delta [Vallitalea longa]GKX30603.1 ATP synthase subunit delta [Vallitalea longa]